MFTRSSIQSNGVEYECRILGWPPDGPALTLDHERFRYAGKFVMTNTGKAVALEDEAVIAAVAFNEDHADPDTLKLRYVTVADDRRGEGIGPQVLDFTASRSLERGYERVAIAVNNPFAFEACYRAGFEYTGETTGIAELVLSRPEVHDTESEATRAAWYRAGLEQYEERTTALTATEQSFIEAKLERGPPEIL